MGKVRWRCDGRHDSHDQMEAAVLELRSKALIGKAPVAVEARRD